MTEFAPPIAAPPTLDAENYVPGLVTWLANKLSAGASQIYRSRFGLGVIDWRVLATVGSEGGATGARICSVVGLDKAAVSRSIALLESRNLITVPRQPGRARVCDLTAEGWQVHNAILTVALDRQRRLLEDFSQAERVLLVGFLHRLLAAVPHVNVGAVE